MSRGGFLAALLALPTIWMAGLWMFDAVRVVASLLLLGLLFVPRVRAWRVPEAGRAETIVFALWAAGFFTLLIAHMLARAHLGMQGIDFAIFAQVIENIGRTGVPNGSLAAQAAAANFLWHHFSPVLYLPGALAALGVPAPAAGVFVHAAGAAVGFGALFVLARKNLGVSVAACIFLAAILASSIRTELFWGLHDDTFAIGFVGLALCFWLRGQFAAAAIAALLTGTCKESFFFFMAWFAIVALFFHRDFHPGTPIRSAARVFVPLIPIGLLGGVAYFFLQPVLAGKNFDHFGKLATFDVLISPRVLFEKLLFLASVLSGSCALGLFTRRGRIVLAMALPLVGIVAIAGDPELYRPFGYAGVVPSVIAFFAAVVSLETMKDRWPVMVSAPAMIFAVCFALSFTTNLPARDVISAAREDGFSPEHLAWIPSDARVAADPGGALALLRVQHLRRLFTVGEQETPEPFDFVVLRPGGWESLPANVERVTEPCHPSGKWVVRCPIPAGN